MRPVTRGQVPSTPFRQYRDAFEPLRTRLGSYCSYCERPILTHLAVEHVQNQDKHPELALTWDNFLLACVNCNSCKREHNDSRAGHLWPDQNNTLLAFSYQGGLVKNALPTAHRAYALAAALLHLVGLDKVPGLPGNQPGKSDDRWQYRQQLADAVQSTKQRLARCDTPEMRAEIIERAKDRGGFSIWFAAFHDDTDMRQRLISAFIGTAPDCFDAEANPVPKPGALI